MYVPVNLGPDFSVGVSAHGLIPPPLPLIPELAAPKTVAIEIPIPQSWPPGVATKSVKKTSTVLHGGLWSIILDGHDCGKFIPQITIPPLNLMLPGLLLGSKRKIAFASFLVRMQGTPVGLTSIWPPLPMMTCGSPVSIPGTFSVTCLLHNTFVNMTLADLVGGVVGILVTMAGDYLIGRFCTSPPGSPYNLRDAFGKALIGAATGLIPSTVQHFIDSRYPIKGSFSLGLPGGHTAKVSVSAGSSDPKNNPNSVGLGWEKQLASDKETGGSVKASAGVSYTWGEDAAKGTIKGEAGVSASDPTKGAAESKKSAEYNLGAEKPGDAQIKVKSEDSINTSLAEGKNTSEYQYRPNAEEGKQHVSTEKTSGSSPMTPGNTAGETTTTSNTPFGVLL